MLLLTADDLLKVWTTAALMRAVEQAASESELAATQPPIPRQHIGLNQNTILVMPAASDRHFGTKIVSVCPGNSAHARPLVQGAMLLVDALVGHPIALLDGAALTALRTGAIGASAIARTRVDAASSLGVVGCGRIGAWVAIFASLSQPIRQLHFFARSDEGARRFCNRLERWAPHVTIIRCSSVEKLLDSVETVVMATPSLTPVLPNSPERLRGKQLVSLGSFAPAMRELPPKAFDLIDEMIVDTRSAALEAGDAIDAVERRAVLPANIRTLGQLVLKTARNTASETTVFKSTGAAVFDLHAATALHDLAQQAGIGSTLELQDAPL